MSRDVPTIMARNMGVRRGGRWALRPATFSIVASVTGLAGVSGKEKSSLLATLATLRRPTTGTLELFGRPAYPNLGRRAARARLGLLPDRSQWATSGLSVRDFITYAAYFKRTSRTAVTDALERFDLTDAAEIEVGLLPADLRLRAGLAATCVHRPELVLLDEPLSGLDEATRSELTPLLCESARTVVVTAPDDAELAWCDRVVTLARGRLVESLDSPRARPGGLGAVGSGLRV